tara:strand:- start:806 stop:1063 length:258 start_codon:yes stop_codon:yes gene_type:complete
MANISNDDLKLLKKYGYYKGKDSVELTPGVVNVIKEIKLDDLRDDGEILHIPTSGMLDSRKKGGKIKAKSKYSKGGGVRAAKYKV